MEDIMQRTSSQTKPLDNNNKIEKLKSPKPPLLPKPQLDKLNLKFPKTVTINQLSPRIINKQDALSPSDQDDKNKNVFVEQTVNFKPNDVEKVNPSTSNKPQLPPKLNVLNCLKHDSHSCNGAVTPNRDLNLSDSSTRKSPQKPPRSPQKNAKKSEGDLFSVKQGLLESSALPKNLILSKQKSASLDRNEEFNWTIENFIQDPEQLSEFCKQVENCSRHSHILKKEIHSQVPALKCREKFNEELDLASNDTCTINNTVIKQNSVSFLQNYYNNKGNSSIGETSNCNNGFLDEKNSGCASSKELNLDAPKSFLHNHINFSHQTKVSEEPEEKAEEKNLNVQSFLHRSKDLKLNLKLSKSHSLGQHDSDTVENHKTFCKSSSIEREPLSRTVNKETKKSDNLLRPNSSDLSSFGKRFPWFGSFGKGGKKDSSKKERCLSQFYSTSTVIDSEAILREKNRAKSLPNIKQSRVISDEVKNAEVADNPEILRLSGEYPHSDSDDDKDSLNQAELVSDKDPSTLAYLKAKELMTSEEVFIDVLKLLNVDFRNYVQLRNFENKNSCIANGEVDKVLNHLSQLQSLNEDILEDLKKRIENWENHPKIADVIVKKGAFLKMYTTYIQNFESQTNYLDECIMKYPKFGKIVREFEASDRCKKLSLKHYMLKPVQRIPQYRLLLNDYLKHLDESSADYADTLSALKIVCEVVDHANRNMAPGDKEGRLMHFQSLLSDFELIKPGRELIKDGPLEKICRKTVRDRYFILLNDCLLHTTYSKQYVKIHQQLPLSGMKICYNDDEKYPLSFTVHSITKSFILCAKSESDCKEWVETLQKTIEEHINRQKTFLNVKIEEDTSFKLGKEAPVWVQDNKVTMCQICTAEFTALFRRHHCRGCGKVVCRNCGSNQAPLQYRNFKPDRVCDQCFELLLKEYDDSEDSVCKMLKETLSLNDESAQNEYLSIKAKFIKYTSASNWKKQKYIPPRLKEVSANDSQSVISGWLHRKSRKSWKMFWYVLKDHVLYVYKASEDVLASETIPVLGYEVEKAKLNCEDIDKNLIFSLVHPRQTPIIFRAESQAAAERWFEALSAATNLDYLTL